MEKDIRKLVAGNQQKILLMVQRIEKSVSRNGSMYQKLFARDSCEHEITVLNWNEPIVNELPFVICAMIETSIFNECNSYRLLSYTVDTTTDKNIFLPKSKINLRDTWSVLMDMIRPIKPGYKKLIEVILMSNQKKFLTYPLSQSKSFARLNGALEATIHLMQMADASSKIMGLNHDLMMTGACLYYIGCIDTINDAFCSSSDEFLLGLGISSYNKMREALHHVQASESEISEDERLDAEDIRLLSHTLLSRYKGVPAAFPEAVALRHLDAIVTETDLMQAYMKDAAPGTISRFPTGIVYQRM